MNNAYAHQRVRRALAVAASGVLVAGVVSTTATAGTFASASVQKSYVYKCNIKAGGFGINPAKVKVSVAAKVPRSVEAGSTIGSRSIKVALRMPEEVRLNAVDILHARKASGRALRPSVGVKIGTTRYRVPVKGLNARKARIPRRNGATWKIHAQGRVAAVRVPKNARGRAKVSVPRRLNVNATLFRRNGSRIKGTMRCKAPDDRWFGTVQITR
ncbi:MAG: DUF6801 domain-containing protein [Nocardioidaceae bacterium]